MEDTLTVLTETDGLHSTFSSGCPAGSLAGELAESIPECRADLAGGFDQWEAVIRAGRQAMGGRGDLRRKANPGRLATAVLAAAEGGMLLAQVRRDPTPLATALDEVLDRIVGPQDPPRAGQSVNDHHCLSRRVG